MLVFDLNRSASRALVLGFLISQFLFVLKGQTQPPDTTTLNTIDIVAEKSGRFATGKREQNLDSSIRNLYLFNTLNMLLSENTGLFIKNYGPGSLSSTSLRGGSAYHSALLWNGFNIQNPMLGQNDLSSMPVFLFDQTAVEYGGSSALWGSGAVSGSILLKNESPFNKGTQTRLSLGSNSFGGINFGLSALYSKSKWALSTKLYGNSSPNTYSFLNDSGQQMQQHQAPYLFRGLMQEFRLKTGKQQELSLNVWLEANDRRIPPAEYGINSKTYQKDRIARFTAAWKYGGKKLQSTVRSAFFREDLDYTDSLMPLYSKSSSQNIILENENFLNYRPHHRLHFGIHSTLSSASANNYNKKEQLQRVSILLGHGSNWFAQRLTGSASIRLEYFSAGALPITGNLSLDYKVMPLLKIQANAAKVYRQPTLNELYWQPGGNPSLKPEQGYTVEGGLLFQKQFGAYQISVGLFAYNRNIRDWVLWIPTSSQISRAENIQEVWSRGTESEWKFGFAKHDFGWQLKVCSNYILSTVQSTGQMNSASQYKQLVYTPRYLFTGSAKIWYEQSALVFLHQYTGYRFVSADNSQWLDPYHLSSLRLNYTLPYKKFSIHTFLACNNLFNSSYVVVQGRPMPLRYYELGLSLDWNQDSNLKP